MSIQNASDAQIVETLERLVTDGIESGAFVILEPDRR